MKEPTYVLANFHYKFSLHYLTNTNLDNKSSIKSDPVYMGSPTYAKISNPVPTTVVFGLCTCKWGFLH